MLLLKLLITAPRDRPRTARLDPCFRSCRCPSVESVFGSKSIISHPMSANAILIAIASAPGLTSRASLSLMRIFSIETSSCILIALAITTSAAYTLVSSRLSGSATDEFEIPGMTGKRRVVHISRIRQSRKWRYHFQAGTSKGSSLAFPTRHSYSSFLGIPSSSTTASVSVRHISRSTSS
jgi:hypothetical protein